MFTRGATGAQPACSFVELDLRVSPLLTRGDHAAADALHGRNVSYLSYWMQGVELLVAVEKETYGRRGLIRSAHCKAPAHALDRHELAMFDGSLRYVDGLLSGDRP
jgi:hypothetical protein